MNPLSQLYILENSDSDYLWNLASNLRRAKGVKYAMGSEDRVKTYVKYLTDDMMKW